mgnify:CR=1 FL=1|jgi:hypothetical protein
MGKERGEMLHFFKKMAVVHVRGGMHLYIGDTVVNHFVFSIFKVEYKFYYIKIMTQ